MTVELNALSRGAPSEDPELVLAQLPPLDRRTKMTQEKLPILKEQRNMILAMFFSEDDDDGEGFLALVEHCGIDLAACHGDVHQIPNVIAGHYRIKKRCYDIDRAANDLLTFAPVAARIAELEAQTAKDAER
jgi:hypothetical protein